MGHVDRNTPTPGVKESWKLNDSSLAVRVMGDYLTTRVFDLVAANNSSRPRLSLTKGPPPSQVGKISLI